MNLTRHTYSRKPSRYYVDGRRVSRDAYWDAIDAGERAGRSLNSMTTRTSYDDTGAAHAIHHSCL